MTFYGFFFTEYQEKRGTFQLKRQVTFLSQQPHICSLYFLLLVLQFICSLFLPSSLVSLLILTLLVSLPCHILNLALLFPHFSTFQAFFEIVQILQKQPKSVLFLSIADALAKYKPSHFSRKTEGLGSVLSFTSTSSKTNLIKKIILYKPSSISQFLRRTLNTIPDYSAASPFYFIIILLSPKWQHIDRSIPIN